MTKATERIVEREIRHLRRSLHTLDRSLRRISPMLMAAMSVNGAPKENGSRRPPRLSAKARASLVLQGRYMGYMRQLNPKQKAQVRKIREAKGVGMAIATAKRLSGEHRA